MEFRKHRWSRAVRHWVSAPIIYTMVIPLFILDAFLTIYHKTCFPLYGIAQVPRKNYIKIDRHKLRYLSPFERIGCAYCGYANGLLAYAARIAGDTEKYWCGIKHGKRKGFVNPSHHKKFVRYGDERALIKKYGR